MNRPRRPWPGPVLLLLLACTACEPASRDTHDSHFYAVGTRVELTLRLTEQDFERAETAVREQFEEAHRGWDGWGGGALGRMNLALETADTAAVPPELEAGLARALELARLSDGQFHPGIGALTETWGFHRAPWPDLAPAPQAIEAARLRVPAADEIRLAGGVLTTDRPGVRIDSGGFAKGLILEAVRDELREQGVNHGLVNAGGDLAVLGDAGERPWRVGILDPRGDGVLARAEARDGECLVTSGDYERGFEAEGHWFHHLLDPATGYPARGTGSATVIAQDCALADVAATAIFVAGPGKWPETAGALGVEQVMVVADDGTAELSPAMAERLDFRDRQPETREMAVHVENGQ